MNHITLGLEMTQNIKNYIYVFMFVGMMSEIIDARDNNRVGTTKLIEFVKQRENELVDLNEEIKNLITVCIPKQTTKKVFGADRDTILTTYWINDDQPELLEKLYKSRQLLKNFEEDTKQQIAEIMEDDISMGAIDRRGKTALNYCKSRDVYNALRSQGAPFQIDSFSSINQYQLLATGLVAAAWAAFLAMTLMATTPADTYHAQDDAINIRDNQGRTPLMNYIIELELEIDPYRIGYTLSTSFVSKITADITKMVEQGADLKIKDFEGKTVIDYCKTQAIYQHLRSLGAPVSFDVWLSFNQDYIIGLSLASAVALIAVAGSTYNHRGQDEVGKLFDTYFEKNYTSK